VVALLQSLQPLVLVPWLQVPLAVFEGVRGLS